MKRLTNTGALLKGLILLCLFNIFSFSISAEGTKQIQRTSSTADRCVLPIYIGSPVSRFATYAASPDQRLYIHIKTPGERVYMGFNEETADYQAVWLRIRDPLGNILSGTPYAIPYTNSTAGHIDTYAQAVAGPSAIAGASGYPSLTFTAAVAGDYWIEFNQTDPNTIDTTTSNFAWNDAPAQIGRELKYWDITVATPGPAAPVAIPGRVWSKEMTFLARTGAAQANPFYGPIYIYTADSVINKADFNGMKPLLFYLHSNATGCTNTGSVATDRQSRNTKQSYAQYKEFLNSPDPADYPNGTSPTINSTPYVTGCAGTNYQINVNTSNVGEIEVILDLNGTAGYQAGTTDVQLLKVATAGNNVVTWNGLDGLGAPVAAGTSIPIIVNYKGGIAHFPLWDAEQNPAGFKLSKVLPASGTTKVYYDDTQIPLGTADVNTGVAGGTATHAWTTTTSDVPSSGSGFGNNRTINTWMVTYFSTKNITYTMAPNCPVYTVAAGKCLSSYTNGMNLATVADADGPINNAVLVSGTFPPGAALNSSTGQITVSNTAALVAGTYNFNIKTTDSKGGVSTTAVSITMYANPTSNAGATQNLCNTSSASLSATGVGTGAWTVISGAGAFSAPTNANTNVTGIASGANVYRYTTTSGGCTAFSDVTVNSSVTPVASNAGSDQNICNAFIATLASNSPAAGPGTGTGTWSTISGPGSVTYTNINSSSSGITVSAYGSYTLRWTIANYCASTFDDVVINFYQTPSTSAAGGTQSVCGLGATMSGNTPAVGTGTWSKVSGPGTVTFTSPNSATSGANVSAYGTYVFQWSISNGSCSASTSNVTINYYQSPSTSVAGSNQGVCGLTTNLSGNTPLVGTGAWTQISGPGAVTFGNASSAGSSASVSTYGTYVFQWTISNGTCPSSSSTVQVDYYQSPTASDAGSSQNVCGFSATLSGNTATIGTGTWSKISGPGSIVFGNVNSPGSTATASAYGTYVLQWSIGNGSCPASVSTVSVTYDQSPTVSNAGADQSLCNTASVTLSANSPVTGTGLWTQVSGPAGATITSASSAGTTVTGLTQGTYVFQWSISNGSCPSSNDQVTVSVFTTPSTASAGPDQNLCAVSSTTMAGNVPTSGLGTWTQVSGPGGATIGNPNNATTGITGLATGTYVFQWTIDNGACGTTSDQMQIITSSTPITTSNAGPDQNKCAVATVTLAGNTPVSGSGIWTKISGPACTITTPSSPTSTVTGMTTGTYVFQWTISNGGCTPSSDQVQIVNSANPSASNAGSDFSVCGTSASLAANNPAIGTGTWALTGGTGTIVSPNSPTSAVTGLGAGINTFRWRITNGTCAATNSNVKVTRDLPPTTANAGSDFSVCSSNGNLSGNTPVNGVGTWTLISGSGTITTPSSPSSTVTALGAGTNTFRWTIASGSCGSSSDDIIITRYLTPTTAIAGNDTALCASTVNLNGNTAVTGTGTWTLVSGAGTIAFPNNPKSNVTGLGVGANVFAWTITNGNCTSTSDNVTITRDQPPTTSDAGLNQNVCGFTANLNGNTPVIGVGNWTQVSGPGSSVFNSPSSAGSSVTVDTYGTYVFQWTISNGTCGSSTSTTSVTFDQTPSTSAAGGTQSVCGLGATMSGNTPAVGTGTWSKVSGPGTVTFTSPNSATSGANVSAYGTYVFQWSISNGSCSASTSNVTINYYQSPSTSVAGSNQGVCGLTTNLSGNTPLVGTGAWTQISGPGAVTFGNASSAGSSASVSTYGTYVFQWTISNGTCPSSSSTVQVDYYQSPTASDAGSSQNVCGFSATLSGNTATIGTGTWSKISGPGSIVFGNVNSPGSTATASAYGTYVLQWSIGNGSCPASVSTVSVTYDQSPTVSNAGADQSLCNTASVTLSANSPVTGTGLWTQVSGPAGATITSASSAGTTVTGLTQGTYVFQWSISNGSCPSSNDQVTVSVFTTPSTASAGPDQNLCAVSSTTMAGNVPTSGLGTWTQVSGPGGATIGNPNNATTGITGLATGTYVFQWTIDNGACGTTSDQMQIITSSTPITTSDAGPDQDLCAANTATLQANTAAFGIGTWSQVSGPAATITAINNPNSTVTGMVAGTYVFQWTITNGGCTPSSDQVQIITSDIPTTSNAGNDTSVCGNSVVLKGNAATVGTGSWSIVSGSGNIVSPGSNNTTVVNLGPDVNVFRWTISNGSCAISYDDVNITRDPLPTTANAGADFRVCSADTLLPGNTPVNGSGAWTLVAGSGVISNPNNPNTAVTGLGTGTNTFRWTITSGSCGSSSDDITITRDLPSTIASAGNDTSVCLANVTLNGNTATVGTGTWTLVSGAGNITSPNNPKTTVTGLGVGANIFVWTISNGSCSSSSDNVTITRDQPATISNAGADQNVCSLSAILSGNTPVIGNGSWSQVSGPGISSFSNASSNTSSVTVDTYGVYSYVWNISNGSCGSSVDTVKITFADLPSAASAGPDQNVCGVLNSILAANAPLKGTGKWSVIGGPGIVTFGNSNLNTSSISTSAYGSYILLWKISNGSCTTTQDTVVVRFYQTPSASNAGPSQNNCGFTATLSANAPSIGIGTWSLYSGLGTATFGNANSANSTVTVNTPGSYVFKWTISNGSCVTNTDTVTISFATQPTSANAGSSKETCGLTAPLNGNTPVVGLGTWAKVSGPGTVTFGSVNSPTSTAIASVYGKYVLSWTISSGICSSTSDTVTVSFFGAASKADAGQDQTFCNVSSINLNAVNPIAGIGSWKVISGNGIVVNKNDPKSRVDNLSYGTNKLMWTVKNGPCSTISDTLTLVVEHCTIAVSKTVDEPKVLEDGSYRLTYHVKVKNLGSTTLFNVSAEDNLIAAFPSPAVVSVASIKSDSAFKVNSAFNGSSNIHMLANGNKLKANEEHEINLEIIIKNKKAGNITYYNSVKGIATDTLSIGNTTDISNNGAYDVNGNGNPNEIGENDPTPVTLNFSDIFIPEGFSPNGDGVNDKFAIEFLDDITVDLTVFNRWGNVVYSKENYHNEWDGSCNHGLHVGSELPDGTYYCIIKLSNGKSMVRYITLKR